MSRPGKLVLKDGSSYVGYFLGDAAGVGEVVFNTGVTGYQEVLTDPSYCGQIVVMTYPLIGNYGVNPMFNQSKKSHVRGYVVGEICPHPSNWRSQGTLADFLQAEKVPCLAGVDTRAITRKIREHGAMHGVIVPADINPDELARLLALPEEKDVVKQVTTKEVITLPGSGCKVALLDFGAKANMAASLSYYDCAVTTYPAYTDAKEIMAAKPDGIFLSNGPGDPKDLPEVIENIKLLIDSKIPIFGICLGYQLLCLALGADTYKMKFGHRGVNQPVKDLELNRVLITSQNHGYAVKEDSLAGTGLKITQRNVNDSTLEGVKHETLPIFAVQYHPEAAPGPDGHTYLFERFLAMMGGQKNA